MSRLIFRCFLVAVFGDLHSAIEKGSQPENGERQHPRIETQRAPNQAGDRNRAVQGWQVEKEEKVMFTRKLDLAIEVALHYQGTLYSWGGDDPSGFDCSGLCIEILKSVGLLPRKGDWTAGGLYGLFKGETTQDATPGCLAFRGSSTAKIVHVEFVVARIGNDVFTIGASGGGSKITTKEIAIKQNAFVKVRPLFANPVAIVNPFWTD